MRAEMRANREKWAKNHRELKEKKDQEKEEEERNRKKEEAAEAEKEREKEKQRALLHRNDRERWHRETRERKENELMREEEMAQCEREGIERFVSQAEKERMEKLQAKQPRPQEPDASAPPAKWKNPLLPKKKLADGEGEGLEADDDAEGQGDRQPVCTLFSLLSILRYLYHYLFIIR